MTLDTETVKMKKLQQFKSVSSYFDTVCIDSGGGLWRDFLSKKVAQDVHGCTACVLDPIGSTGIAWGSMKSSKDVSNLWVEIILRMTSTIPVAVDELLH